MAIRRRKKVQIDEGPFLFTEEEMAGKIENVTIVPSPVAEETEGQKDNRDTPNHTVVEENTLTNTEPFSDERMIKEMENVLRQMNNMTQSQIRLIALTTTMQGQNGLYLYKTYNIPSIKDSAITGYEFAAWCYCSFMEAFPQMKDKLQLPYSTHYEKAKANI